MQMCKKAELQETKVRMEIYVTDPAKINHVSAEKSPIFSVFALS